jgi:hypothetical protein
MNYYDCPNYLSEQYTGTGGTGSQFKHLSAKDLSAGLGVLQFLETGKIPGRRKGTDKDSRHLKGVYRVRVVMPE